MEGLEIKELFLSGLKTDNEKLRLDDEFFLKKFINAYAVVKKKPHIPFNDIIDVLTDYHANGSYEALNQHVRITSEPDHAYMVRSTDLERSDFKMDVRYISESAYNYLAKTKLEGGEILINKIGNPGRVYIMPKLDRASTLGMNLFMIRLKNKSGFKERFVWAFFNSELGQRIIYRKINGTVPLTIDKSAIRSLYIPKLSENYQILIEKIILDSENFLSKAKSVYSYAESLLVDTLDLRNPSLHINKTTNIKFFANLCAETGRLDAEYYQCKYENLLTHLTAWPHSKLSDLVSIKKSIEPGSEAYTDEENGIPFLRVADYDKFNLNEPKKRLDTSFVLKNRLKLETLMPKKETILFSKDGSVGQAYCLRRDADFITSGAILHLSLKEPENLLPDYMTLVLNSKIVQMQAERDVGGSIILHWRVSEIEKVIIPLMDLHTQSQIASLIQESFTLKVESERLLNLAKQAVEMAIEQDEESATKWIQEQLNINQVVSDA